MVRKGRMMACQLGYQIGHNKHNCVIGKKQKTIQNSSQQEDAKIERNPRPTQIPSMSNQD